MPSIGERLRLAREQQGRSLSELADETCISSRYLHAIESDQPKVVPGHFFYRNYVKQYATALKLDAAEFARAVDALGENDEANPLPAMSAAAQSRAIGARARPWRSSVAVALLAATLAGGSALHAWLDRPSADPQPAPAVESPAAPITTVANSPEQAPQAAAPTVKLAATERTWVSVSENGRTVFRGTMQPAETRDFPVADNTKLLTGNAAGIDVMWNGKAIGPLGERGQVRMIVFTPSHYQIVSPRM